MKKLFAILLAVLMVVPTLALGISAEDPTPAAQKLNIIPVITEYDTPDADMDTGATSGWKNTDGGHWGSDTGLVYKAEEKAFAKTWIGETTINAGGIKFHYQNFAKVDITDILETGAICFDLYLSDPDALNVDTVKYDFELRSPVGAKDGDNNEWNAINKLTLSELYGGELQAGWNHFELPLSLFKLVDKADDGVTPDPTQIYYFRFYNSNNGVVIGGEGENTIMMKNIYFVDQCTYEAPEAPYDRVIDVWDGRETQTMANGGKVAAKAAGTTQGGQFADVDGDGTKEFTWIYDDSGNGGYLHSNGGYNDTVTPNRGAKLDIKFSTPIDTNEHFTAIQFDIYISDTKVKVGSNASTEINATNCTQSLLSTTWMIELCSNGTFDQAEINWQWSLAQMFGDYIQPNQWYTVALDINHFKDCDFSTTANRTPEDAPYVPTNTNYIRIYNIASFTYMGDIAIAMKNIRAVRDVPEVEERRTEIYGVENDQASSTSVTRVMNTTMTSGFVSSGTGAVQNKAIIAEHFKAGVEDSSGGGKYATVGGLMCKFAPMDSTGMDTLCFDLYLDFYGEEQYVTNLQDLWEKPWQIEISSSGGRDHYEKAHNTTLAKLTGVSKADVTSSAVVDGWHHVEIPLNDFLDSSKTEYIDMTAINLMSLWLNTIYTPLEGVYMIAMYDNLYLKDSTYQPYVAPEAELGVTAAPTLKSSFNLNYTVKANESVISNPVVNVTFDGKTTTEGTTFAFEGILAHRLSETITTTVTALDADHRIIREKITYSVKQYAENMLAADQIGDLNAEQIAALKRLLSDALYYGGAAQSSINYKTDNLASNAAGILDKVELNAKALADCKIEKVLTDNAAADGPAWKSASLVLNSELAIRFAFTGEAESVTIGGETYGSADFKFHEEKNYYYIDFPVSAKNFDVVYTAYFNGNADYAVNYSVNHYLATKYTTTSPMADLLASIYNYGLSADAYAALTGQN